MRVFVGIKMGWDIQAEVTEWQREHAKLAVRWIPLEDLHVTLVPPWDVENVDDVLEKMRECAHGIPAINVTFSVIEAGPNPQHPSIIWTRADPHPELVTLRNKLVHTFGADSDHAFTPHITVAREQHHMPITPLHEDISWQTTANNVTLYRTTGGGAGYVVLGEVGLLG